MRVGVDFLLRPSSSSPPNVGEEDVCGMSNTCACCQSKMKFIRQINGNFQHSIVIPEWFLNHFRGKISGTIKLEAPDGYIYDVGVTENMNKAILQSGWEAFIDGNQIEVNYSLMFRYLGISRFKVTIFDANGMEKVPCCAGTKIASNVQKPSNYCVDICSSSRDVTTRSSADEGSHRDGWHMESSCHYGKSAKMPVSSYSSEELSAEDNPSVDESAEPDDLQTLSKNYVLSVKCNLTEAQEAQIHVLVRKIQPKIPLLVVRMKKSSVEQQNELTIRKNYALTYFPHESQTITLQLPKKSKVWQCRFHIRLDRGDRLLKLRQFVHDNHVQEGDICLFQPITEVNARRFTVVAHLLPKESNDLSLDGKTDIGSNHDWKRAKMASTVSVKEEPVTDGEEISCSENEEHGVSDNSDEDSDPLFMLPHKTCLTKGQEKKVLAQVQAIESELPIYVAVMNKSSVYSHHTGPACILVFGKPYATGYLGTKCTTGRRGNKNAIKLELQREGHSKTWHTILHRTIIITSIQKGWGSFARDNRLRERDICLFELAMKNEQQLKMMVYIIRRERC